MEKSRVLLSVVVVVMGRRKSSLDEEEEEDSKYSSSSSPDSIPEASPAVTVVPLLCTVFGCLLRSSEEEDPRGRLDDDSPLLDTSVYFFTYDIDLWFYAGASLYYD